MTFPGKPMPVAGSAAIVTDRDLNQSIVVIHPHARLGGARMSKDVCQGLAGYPVHRCSGLAGYRLDVVREC